MHVTYMKDASAVQQQADMYAVMATAVEECAGIVVDARAQLDSIDHSAHEEIDAVIASRGGWFGALAMLAMIWQIITRARADAEAVSAAVAGQLGAQASKIAAVATPVASRSARPDLRAEIEREFGSLLPSGNRDSFGLNVSGGNRPLRPPPARGPADSDPIPEDAVEPVKSGASSAVKDAQGTTDPLPEAAADPAQTPTTSGKPLGRDSSVPEGVVNPPSSHVRSAVEQAQTGSTAILPPVSPASGMSASPMRTPSMPSMPSTPAMPSTPSMPATPTTPAGLPTPATAANDLSQGFTKGLAASAANPLPPSVPTTPHVAPPASGNRNHARICACIRPATRRGEQPCSQYTPPPAAATSHGTPGR